jgi:hypothetical protein
MIKNKVGSKKAKKGNLSNSNINILTKNNNHKKTSREKIIIAEKRSIIKNNIKMFFKNNVFKIATTLLILFVILVNMNMNKKINIDENTDISKLSYAKYNSEILDLYNRDGQLDLFLAEMNRVQSLVGMYVVSNSTLKENSFSNLVKTLNKEINDDNWVTLNSEKSKYYNGTYSIDESGNLKFKFSNKSIEPEWINDGNISRYIILN